MESTLLGKKLTDDEKIAVLLSNIRAGFDEWREYEIKIRNIRKRLAAEMEHIDFLLTKRSK